MRYPLSPLMIVTLLMAVGIVASDNNYLHGTQWLTLVAITLAVTAASVFVTRYSAPWRYAMAAMCLIAVLAGWVANRTEWRSIERQHACVRHHSEQRHTATIVSQPMPHAKVSTMTVQLDDGLRTQLSVPLSVVATDSMYIGQRICFEARLRPVVLADTDSFYHHHLQLLRSGTTATAYTRHLAVTAQPSTMLMRLRRTMQRRIDGLHIAHNSRALVRALTLADRSQLSMAQTDDFRQAGVAHLLALSGMHLAVVVGLLLLLFGHDVRDRWRNFVCISVLVWLYVMLAGSPTSLTRAAWFCTLMLLCSAMRRHAMLFDQLWATLFIMLIVSPHSLFDIGLQLSFAAMAAIALVTWLWPRSLRPSLKQLSALQSRDNTSPLERIKACVRIMGMKMRYGIRSMLIIGIACSLATAPFALLAFGRVAPMGIIATIVLSPLTLIIIVVALATLALPLPILTDALDLLCHIETYLAHFLASL